MAFGEVTRKAWEINGVAMIRNPSSMQITPQVTIDDRMMLNMDRKLLSPRRLNDPRTVRYVDLNCTWFYARRALIVQLTHLCNFINAGFTLKPYQADYPRLNSVTPNLAEAATMLPANFPIVGSCQAFFLPLRGISADSGDGPFLYRNGAAVTSGITWDYAEGKVTFASAIPSSDLVQCFFRWKPVCRVAAFESNPVEGRPHDDPRYNPTLTLKQL